MKKILIALVLLPLMVLADTWTDPSTGIVWTYVIKDGNAQVGSGFYSSRAISDSTVGAITIPSILGGYPVTSVGSVAFEGCSGLTSVTIPSSVTSIGNLAFYNCSGLTSVTIPSSVTSIGNSVFSGCSRLTSVTIPSSVTSIGRYAFDGTPFYDNQLNGFVILGKVLHKYKGSCPASVVIPKGVMYIGFEAFYGCSGLTSVTISEGVTSIGTSAFAYCRGLMSVTILSGVTSIGECAFEGCSGLTSVTIPSSVTSIGESAFYDCSGLTSVTISEGVTSIGDLAFSGCSGLTSVTIPSSVTSIGNSVFSGCSGIKTVVVETRDVDRVKDLLRGSGLDVSNITFVERMADGGPYTEMVDGVAWTYVINDGKTQVGGGSSSSRAISTSTAGAITIPSTLGGRPVTSIGNRAFSGCSGLTSVTIPLSVMNIGDSAFYNCSGLTSMTIPSSVTSIGWGAFYGCSGLTSVTIPSSVTSIGGEVFSGCSGLKSFSVVSDNPAYASINGLLCSKDGTTLMAGVNGEVLIPSSVTSIGELAFEYCSGLTSVTIPSSVTSIGRSSFYGCSGLTSVTIPSSVTSIGESAFHSCSGLMLVTISDGVTNIGRHAFYGCSGLTSVTIPSSVTSIVEGAFYGCSGLTSVTIPSGVTSIGWSAFCGCNGLKSVTIPSSVTNIENYAFYGCSGLTSVTIPSSVTSIGGGALRNCSGLTSVTIPSSVTSIGGEAFRDCSGLGEVEFEGAPPEGLADCDLPVHAFVWYNARYADEWQAFLESNGMKGASYKPSSSTPQSVVLPDDGVRMVNMTVTNVIVNYVFNSVQPHFVIPATADTGFVNIIAEVKGGAVAVPSSWAENYPNFVDKFGSDFTKVLTMKTGKKDGAGNEMLVWQDYVAGTDPTDENDVFRASITIVEGQVKVSWTPELDAERAALRKYTTWGKKSLMDAGWAEVPAGSESEFNFFKVVVEMK